MLAVAGTHGNHHCEHARLDFRQAGLNPGYPIGGAPNTLNNPRDLAMVPFSSLRTNTTPVILIAAQSLYIMPAHVNREQPRVRSRRHIPDIDAIQAQFHLLLRTVPQGGLVVVPSDDEAVNEVLHQGCWMPIARVGSKRRVNPLFMITAIYGPPPKVQLGLEN